MQYDFFPDEDSVYFKLSDKPFAFGKDLSDERHLNMASENEIIGIEFLYISDGVDLSGIPIEIQNDILPVLEQKGIRVYA